MPRTGSCCHGAGFTQLVDSSCGRGAETFGEDSGGVVTERRRGHRRDPHAVDRERQTGRQVVPDTGLISGANNGLAVTFGSVAASANVR